MRKNTPSATKEKKPPTYLIVDMSRSKQDPEKWFVTFEKWHGCRCNAKKQSIVVEKANGKIPTRKDLVLLGY